MTATPPAERATARLLVLLLATCTTLALVNLPDHDLPAGWLLAFVLPGALLAWLAPLVARPGPRLLLAGVLLTATCLLALYLVGPMSRPAALACTILPPLGFATARCQGPDQPLALFLGFCVLLVGVILDGVDLVLVSAFAIAATLALRCASRLAILEGVRPARSRQRPAREAMGGALLVTAGCLLAAWTVDQTLAFLPSPSRRPVADVKTSPQASSRRPGLDDSFVLDGKAGLLADLTGEQLVRVAATGRGTVPADLYLRSGFFATPSLDRWQPGKLELTRSSRDDGHVLRAARPEQPVRRLELERFAGARNFVFVPPHTCQVMGVTDLLVDSRREWIRQRRAADSGPYEVSWQPAPALAGSTPVERRDVVADLFAVPPELDRSRSEALLTAWAVGSEPVAAMERIAAGLARHCRYDRIEPSGPFGSAIENFLFAAGDRRGYCMHFASAAALLLRLRGIPCRIGVGLYGGDPDRDDPAARMFGSQHAHAWVEVPFAGLGYVVFDPTPPSDRGQPTPRRRDAGPADAGAAIASADPFAALLDLLMQPWLLALLAGMTLAALTWRRRRPASGDIPPTPAARNARRLLARLLHALAAVGHVRGRRQTLDLFASELARAGRLLPEIAGGFAAYQEVRFGGRTFDDARERALQTAIATAQAMQREPANQPAAG